MKLLSNLNFVLIFLINYKKDNTYSFQKKSSPSKFFPYFNFNCVDTVDTISLPYSARLFLRMCSLTRLPSCQKSSVNVLFAANDTFCRHCSISLDNSSNSASAGRLTIIDFLLVINVNLSNFNNVKLHIKYVN